jgi:hypothetical protein
MTQACRQIRAELGPIYWRYEYLEIRTWTFAKFVAAILDGLFDHLAHICPNLNFPPALLADIHSVSLRHREARGWILHVGVKAWKGRLDTQTKIRIAGDCGSVIENLFEGLKGAEVEVCDRVGRASETYGLRSAEMPVRKVWLEMEMGTRAEKGRKK